MYDEIRTLSIEEHSLRHRSGDDNLVSHPSEWYSYYPQHPDQVVQIQQLTILLAGPSLLSYLGALGAKSSTLQIGLFLRDRYGGLRDHGSTLCHCIEEAAFFKDGQHHMTHMDPEGGTYKDGTPLPALRGGYVSPGSSLPQPYWISCPLELSERINVREIFWTVDDIRDVSGVPLNAYNIQLRLGTTGTGGIVWQTIEGTASEVAYEKQRFSLLGAGANGDVVQWHVKLRYGSVSQIAQGDPFIRTPSVFRLGFVYKSPSQMWNFSSLSELLTRSMSEPVLLPGNWSGNLDTVLVRVGINLRLDQSLGEYVGVRLVPSEAVTSLKVVQAKAEGFIFDKRLQ